MSPQRNTPSKAKRSRRPRVLERAARAEPVPHGPAAQAARALVLSGSLARRVAQLEAALTSPGGWRPAGSPFTEIRRRLADVEAHVRSGRHLAAVEAFAEAEQVARLLREPLGHVMELWRRRQANARLAAQSSRGVAVKKRRAAEEAAELLHEAQRQRKLRPGWTVGGIIGYLIRENLTSFSRSQARRHLTAAGFK